MKTVPKIILLVFCIIILYLFIAFIAHIWPFKKSSGSKSCNDPCNNPSDCTGATNGCTNCINGKCTTYSPPNCNDTCTNEEDCRGATNGCTNCIDKKCTSLGNCTTDLPSDVKCSTNGKWFKYNPVNVIGATRTRADKEKGNLDEDGCLKYCDSIEGCTGVVHRVGTKMCYPVEWTNDELVDIINGKNQKDDNGEPYPQFEYGDISSFALR